MRSSEVAKAADVSVRTLRHYHALGLLPEPARSENGYRDYSPLDVARVLHIKRLASLGLSLADIAKMLGAESESDKRPQNDERVENVDRLQDDKVDEDCEGRSSRYDEELAALDAELERKIEMLQEQRKTIAVLRAEKLDPALPIEFARAVSLLYGGGGLVNEDALCEEEKAVLILAAQAYREGETKELERFARAARTNGSLEKLHAISKRIDALAPDASVDEQTALVEDAIRILEPFFDCFDSGNWLDEYNENGQELYESLADSLLNPAQRAVNDRIEQEIVAHMRAREESAHT